MINRNDWVNDFQKNISDLIARSPAADIERNMRAFVTQTFSRLDLVTREEFDIQVQLVEKAMLRITALESRLDQLEGRQTPTAPHTSPAVEPSIMPGAPLDRGTATPTPTTADTTRVPGDRNDPLA